MRLDTEAEVAFEDITVLLLCARELVDIVFVLLDIVVTVILDGWVVTVVLLSCGFVDAVDNADEGTDLVTEIDPSIVEGEDEEDFPAIDEENTEDLDESSIEEREIELGDS